MKAASQPVRRRAVIEALEARILFAADFSPALLAPAAATTDVRTLDSAPPSATPDAAASVRHELIVVDANTPDYEKLVQDFIAASQTQNGSTRQFDVVVLDPDRDGIAQISEVLARYSNLDAVHLISHGAAGSIELGSTRLDASTLAADADRIAGWRSAFAADGDLLIYGCNVAATAEGQHMLASLAHLTGTDVAASTDATGATALGGDWTLEYHRGVIDTAAAPASAFANWTQTLAATPVGGETPVNTTTAGTQQAAASAMDANGNYVVVWVGTDSSGTGIFAQRYNAAGAAQGGEFRVNSTTANDQSQPDVAMDDAGDFVVVWRSANQDGSGLGVYAQRYDASGTAQGGEFRVNTTTASDQSAPSVALDANGNFVVAWQSVNGGLLGVGANLDIFIQRYNAAGVAQGVETQVNTYASNDQSLPDVGIDASGNFTVVWQSEKGLLPLSLPGLSLSDLNIAGQRFDASGTELGSEFTIGTTTGSQQAPAISVNATGDFVVAWQSDQNGSFDIFAQRYSAAGVAQGSQIAVNATTSGDQTAPDVARSDLGDFAVVWQSAGQDGSGAGVYLQQFTAAGAKDGGEVQVNTTTSGAQQAPALGMDDAGNFVVAWDGNGVGDTAGVFTQLYDAPNVPPSLALPGGGLTWTEDTPPAVVDGGALVGDLDSPDFDTGSLTVDFTANASVDDRLAIRDGGTAAGQIGVAGSSVTYGGVDIGSFSGGSGSTPLLISFNANASIAAVQALTRSITYQNVSQNPSTLARTLRFTLDDGDGGSTVATTTLNVIAVDDAPLAADDAASGNEDTVITGNVLANDSDVDNSPGQLRAVLVGGPAHGTLSLNADGSFSYTPNANYNGSDSFTYQVSDGTLLSNVATVTLAINPVNDPPLAVNDSATVNEGAAVTLDLASNDSDVDSALDPNSIKIVGAPAHGIVVVGSNGNVTYTHDGSETTADSFTYTISDVQGAVSNVATVTLAINPVNDPPLAVADSFTGDEDTAIAGNVLANDTDPDSPTLTATLKTGPAHGTLTLNQNGSFSYTPNANYNGSDTFTYLANDGALDANVATVTLTIKPVNDAPVAVNDAASGLEDTPISGNVLGNDSDIDSPSLTAVLVKGPAHGTLTLNANGGFSYTPNANYNGSDSFSYSANDGALNSNVATVAISIAPVNDAPTFASASVFSAPENVAVSEQLAANDVDGDAVVWSIVGGKDAALFNLNAGSGQLSLKFVPDFEQPLDSNHDNVYEVTVRGADGNGGLFTQPVRVIVTDVPEAPTSTPGGGTKPTTGGGTPVVVTPPRPVELPLFAVAPVRVLPVSSAPLVETVLPVETVREPVAGLVATSLSEVAPASAIDDRASVAPVAFDPGNPGTATVEPALQVASVAAPAPIELGQQLELNAARASFIGLSLGALWWVVQTGGLLSAMLASMPVWRNLDTLSILDEDEEGTAIAATDADSDDTDLFGPGR